jgi:hypothetical protein
LGSLAELECELLLAGKLEIVSAEACHELIAEIGSIQGMLQKLHCALPAKKL